MNNQLNTMRPAWIEVDLDSIKENTRAIKRFVGPTTAVMAIVKANAYGHGLVPVARAALAGGAAMLGVAILDEALTLRDAGIDASILVLGCGLPEQAPKIVGRRITQVVTSREMAEALSREAVRQGTPAIIHIKVDTGMGRVGVMWQEAVKFIGEVRELPGLTFDGLMTHFPTADEPDKRFTCEQLSRFDRIIQQLSGLNIHPRWQHTANSGAIAFVPESHYDIVRPGLILYGVPPTPEPCAIPLKPALSLKARVTQIKTVEAGESISYGRTYFTNRRSRVAIVPLGYADGFSRRHSNRGRVLIHGTYVPIIGRVCMDQFVVDVTDIAGVEIGDEVVIIGRQRDGSETARGRNGEGAKEGWDRPSGSMGEKETGGQGDGERQRRGEAEITLWDVAASMESIPNEVLSALGERLPRKYLTGLDAMGSRVR